MSRADISTNTIIEGDAPESSAGSSNLSRRDAIRAGAGHGSSVLGKLGLAAIPLALAAMARDAAAQTSTDLLDGLQFLLLNEYLQTELHFRALAASGFVPTADFGVIQEIHAQDATHANLITAAISSLNATPNSQPAFDWTAKGNFPGFNFAAGQYETYKIIAQGLKDLSVRIYKGQCARMTISHAIMTQMLSMHSVEARHSAEIRLVRGKTAWITGKSRDDLPAFFQPVYDGEEVTTHNGFDSSLIAVTSATAATEAFDEPLTKAQASAIITPFLA